MCLSVVVSVNLLVYVMDERMRNNMTGSIDSDFYFFFSMTGCGRLIQLMSSRSSLLFLSLVYFRFKTCDSTYAQIKLNVLHVCMLIFNTISSQYSINFCKMLLHVCESAKLATSFFIN